MNRRSYAFVIIAIGGVIVAIGAIVFWPRYTSFDPAVWQDEARVRSGERLMMADDIVARRLLSNKSRSEVIMLLGEPPETKYFSDWDLVYWLGPERGFMSIDSEWLVVQLDADERVSDYRIVRD